MINSNSQIDDFKLIGFNDSTCEYSKSHTYFVAPEIIEYGSEEGDSIKRDMWAIGALTYLLFSGDMFDFTDGEIPFENQVWQDVSEDAKSFIQSLLDINASSRLDTI